MVKPDEVKETEAMSGDGLSNATALTFIRLAPMSKTAKLLKSTDVGVTRIVTGHLSGQDTVVVDDAVAI